MSTGVFFCSLHVAECFVSVNSRESVTSNWNLTTVDQPASGDENDGNIYIGDVARVQYAYRRHRVAHLRLELCCL
jgi:hypothetical protein